MEWAPQALGPVESWVLCWGSGKAAFSQQVPAGAPQCPRRDPRARASGCPDWRLQGLFPGNRAKCGLYSTRSGQRRHQVPSHVKDGSDLSVPLPRQKQSAHLLEKPAINPSHTYTHSTATQIKTAVLDQTPLADFRLVPHRLWVLPNKKSPSTKWHLFKNPLKLS